MNRLKHTILTALALAMSLGAWAQQEVLLTTVTATGQTSYSETTPGVVTVTHDNSHIYYEYGWVWWDNPGSVTVVANEGYTITRCVFSQPDDKTVTVSTAPFKVNFIYNGDYEQYRCEGTDPDEGMDGVASIEVYGYAADPSPTVTRTSDNNWTFTMPGYNAALNVTYYLQPNLAWTYNSAAMPAEGLTAYRGFELPVIGGIGASMDEDFLTALEGGTVSLRYGSVNGIVTFNNPNDRLTATITGSGLDTVYMVFDGNDDFLYDSAFFPVTILDPDTLTLASNDTDKGTVSALLGGDAVWNNETWANMSSSSMEHSFTVGDITLSHTGNDRQGFVRSGSSGEPLFFFVQAGIGSDLTFTSNGAPFTRIDMEMVNEYTSGRNPNIQPLDGWTFDGQHAVWEGNAQSVTMTSCTTSVDQITFTRGSDSIVVLDETAGTYLVIPGATVQAVAEAQDGNYVSAWSNSAAVTNRLSDTIALTVSESQTLTATFAQNPVLTLAANNSDWGTVELDGMGVGTVYNITFEHETTEEGSRSFTIPASRMPYDTTFSYNANITDAYAYDQIGGSVSKIAQGDNWVTVRISGAFEYGGYYSCEFEGASDDWSISCTTGTGPVYPDGVTAGTTANTYRVLPGTEVKVIATPDSAHYFVNWNEETALNSNTAVEKTLTMGTDDTELTANFAAKPTLTLAANNSDWGSVEMPLVAGPETLLTTINASGSITSGSQTFDNVATVTFTGQTTYESSVWMAQYGDGKSGTMTLSAAEGVNVTGYKLYFNYSSPYTITASSATLNLYCEGSGRYVYYQGDYIGNEGISKIEVYGTVSAMPAGVEQLTAGTFRVLPGTEVKVIATPDSAHYFVNWDEETALNSNTAVEKTLTMGTDDATLTANFAAKPTLTLAANNSEWGSVEVAKANEVENMSIGVGGSLYTGTHFSLAYTAHQYADRGVSGFTMKSGQNATITATDGKVIRKVVLSGLAGSAYNQSTTTSAGTIETEWAGSTITINDVNATEVVISNTNSTGVSATRVAVYYEGEELPAGVVDNGDGTYRVDFGTTVTAVATAKDGYHMDSWSNGAAVTDLLVNNNTVTVTTDSTIRANFIANPLLTLASNNSEWGTVELDGMGVDTVYNITFVHQSSQEGSRTFTASSLPYDTTFSYNDNIDDAIASDNLSKIGQGEHTVTIRISGPFEGYGSYTCRLDGMGGFDIWTISCEASTVPVYPDGITKTGDNTYRVLPGTQVKVIATPDSAHYFVNWTDSAAVNSNIGDTNTLTMGTAPATLTANFALKPTLTLAHNDGGEMEIVPAGGVTAIVPPTDQINLWEDNYGGFLAENDMPATLGFVAVDQAAAEAWTGAPASGEAMLIYDIDEEDFYYLLFRDGSLAGNNDATFSPGGFYAMASDGVLYITTGATPSNVTATAEPNTYYIDYNTSVTVKATPSDTTYLVRFDQDADTNSNVAVEKTYGPLTANVTARATFNDKPVLTLASNNGDWGTVALEGAGSGSSNGYTIKFSANGNTIVKENVTLPKTYQCEYGSPSEFDNIIRELYGWTGVHGNENAIPTVTGTDAITPGINSDDYPKFTINSAFQGTATVTIGYTNSSWVSDNWPIEISFVPALPAGVAQLDSVTYRVDYGTEVTVNAEATELHHVANWEDQNGDSLQTATYSAYFITEPEPLFPDSSALTFTVTTDTVATAMFGRNFYQLTLAHNEGGQMEFVIPQDSMSFTGIQETSISRDGITITADSADLEGMFLKSDKSIRISMADASITQVDFHVTNGTNLVSTISVEGSSEITTTQNNEYGSVKGLDTNLVVIKSSTDHDLQIDQLTVHFGRTLPEGVLNGPDSNTYYVLPDSTVVVRAIPADGHYLVNWDGYTDILDTLTASVTMSGDDTLTATFAPNPVLTLAVSDEAMGSVYFTGYRGNTITRAGIIKAESIELPYQWYEASEIMSIEGGNGHVTKDQNSHYLTVDSIFAGTATVVTSTGAFSVSCEPTLPNGVHYNIAADNYTVMPYTELSLTATPNADHYFVDWAKVTVMDSVRDSVIVSQEAVQTFRIDGDMKLQGNFLHNPYVLTLKADTVMGTVEADTAVVFARALTDTTYSVMADSTVTLVAAALTGYHITGWSNDTTVNSLNSLVADTIEVKMTMDSLITISFDTNIYNVTLTVQNDERTQQPMGTVTGADSVKHFLSDTLTVEAEYGYTFKGWYSDTNLVSAEDTLVLSPVSDTALMARFTVNQYAIRGLAADTLAGYVKGSDSVAYLDTVVLYANANTGYHFVAWEDTTGLQLGAADSLQIIVVSDSTVYAVFDTLHYNLVVKVDSASNGFGTVSGSDSVARHFAEYTIVATADSGYHFVQWSNGSTKAIDTVSLVSDSTIAAVFDTNVYRMNIVVADSCTGRGTVMGDSIAKHFLSYDISATPNPGYHFVAWSDGDSNATRTVELTSDSTIAAIFDYNPSLTLVYNEQNGDVQFIVESQTATFNNITTTSLASPGLTVTADSADAYGISLKNGKTLTITADSAVINQVAFHLTNGTNKAATIQATAGTVNATNGNAYGAVTDIRQNTVTISSTSDKDINIDQLTIQYAPIMPAGVVRLDSDDPDVYRVDYNTVVSLLAVPADSNYLDSWAGDTTSTDDLTAVVTIDSSDATVYINFSGNPMLTLTANGNGRVFFEGYEGYTVNRNENILVTNFTDFPHTWYEAGTITEINGGEGMISKDNTEHYLSVAGPFNGTATVVTSSGSFNVTCIPTVPNGISVMSLDTYIMEPGTEVTVNAVPDAEHYLVNWDDLDSAAAVRDTAIRYNTHLVANFLHLPYTLTVNVDTVMGSAVVAEGEPTVLLNADGTYTVMADSTVAIVANASEGYHLTGWSHVEGVMDTVKVTMTMDSTISVSFDTNVYNVTYTVQNDPRDSTQAMGTASLAGQHKHFLNDTLTVEAIYGYTFAGWYADTVLASTADTFVFSPVSDTAFEARFTVNQYAIVGQPQGEHMGSVAGSDTVDYLDAVVLRAVAGTGYHFVNWEDTTGLMLGTADTLEIVAVSDSTVKAVFDSNHYQLAVRVMDSCDNCGTVSGSDSVARHFANYTVIAEATPCYHFVSWTDTLGNVVSTDDTLTVSPVSDTLLVANFDLNIYTGDTTVDVCDQFTWHDSTYTVTPAVAPTYTYKNANGCDSTVTLNLTIRHATTSDTTAVVCDSFDWYEHTGLTASVDTLKHVFAGANAAACDSTVTLKLTVNYKSTGDTTAVVCDTMNWYEHQAITESVDTLTHLFAGANQYGCDSTVTLHLTVKKSTISVLDTTVCEQFTWNAIDYFRTTTAFYYDTNAAGCDSTAQLNLTVNHSSESVETVVTCDTTYDWNGFHYTTSTLGIYHTTNQYGCDSTATLNLTLNNAFTGIDEQQACESFTWVDGITYTESTNTPTFVYQMDNGCDSTVTLNLTISNNLTSTDVQTACESFTWIDGVTYTESTNTPTYVYHLGTGCDSTVTLDLTVNNTVTNAISAATCSYYIWDGTYYNESGSYTKTYEAANGCDSVVTLTLTVSQALTTSISESSCGEYTWNGITYASSGAYSQTFQSVDGCDSTVTLTLTVKQPASATVTVIAGGSYEWNGQTYTESGNYTYTTTGSNGCDSVTTLQLTINNAVNGTETMTACGSYTWNGTAYTESGDYTYSHLDNYGNTQVDTLHLTINNSVEHSFADAACSYYIWDGTYYNQSGTYTKHYTAANGCDSVATLTLTVNQPVTAAISETACGSYTWNNVTYTASGAYTQTFTNVNGCDSTVTLTLNVNQPTTATVVASACDSYEWNGTTYTASGNYTYTTEGSNGCDSVTTLQLTVAHTGADVDNVTACDSYTWIDGVTYTASTNEPTHTISGEGCDVVMTLNLTIKNSVENSFDTTACSQYVWDGTTYAESGSYDKRYTAANGCDSVATLNLTINQPVTANVSETACGSYTWNDTTYTATGVYSYTTTGSNGCDSTVTLTLTIKQPVAATVTATACDSYTWHDSTYTETPAVAPTYTTTGSNGCDSVTTLLLTVKHASTGIETLVACDSLEWHGTVYTENNNTATFTMTNAANCDSVVTLNLTIKISVESSFADASCSYYIWDGSYYNESGDYTKRYTAANSCDSVVTLTLTVNQPVTNAISENACGSYTWNNIEYTASGAYTQSFTGSNGCDSTVTLTLTVKQPTTATVVASACDSYEWNGTTYTVSGNYTYTTTGSNGCDSTTTLHLTISNPVHTTETEATCGSYTWNGTVYTESGDYTYSHADANGCTQVDTLHLTINNPVHTAETEATCGSYTWNGTVYTTSGDYTYSHTDANGCTQVDTLHLTINNPVHTAETEVACGSYTWNGTVYTESGDYTYSHTDNNGCTQVDTLHLTIGNSVATEETVTNCDSYEWNDRMYTESGDYTYSTTTATGCDSTVTLHLTINHSAASSFDTLCYGSFVWNGETFTESGTYVRTLTTVTGCDSVVTVSLVILPEGFVMPYLYNLMDVMLTINHNEEGLENVNYVYYRWYRDGELVLEGPDYDSYSEGGSRLNGCYYVEVAVDENMEYWVRSNEVCIGSVGIDDVEDLEFSIAPNPVMHGSMVNVSVDGADLQGAEIRVYDLQGRMIRLQKDNGIIEAPQASGTYIVRLTLNDGRTAVKRLIVR